MKPATIAVIAFDGTSPFHLSVPFAVFGEDRRTLGIPRHEVKLCAERGGSVATSAGFALTGLPGLDALKRAGIVVVPSWRDPAEPPPPAVLRALRAAHARGALLVGLCLGSYVLAAAGLLDGRRATTHWAWADDLAARHPRVRIDRDVLYVDEGEILTSAGGAAGLDCCLHLARRLHGAEIAGRIARRMVVPPHRPGGQAQYIEQPLREEAPGVDRFAEMLAWVERTLDRPHRLDALAARACLSRRTFTRRFREATGTTFGAWLADRRLALAQRLLETTRKPVAQVAREAGFGTEASLRQHFRKAVKVSPTAYRKTFRSE